MEIRLNADDNFMNNLSDKFGGKKTSVLVKDALTLLNWVADEVSNGRVILSASEEGRDLKQLAMPALNSIVQTATKQHN
jgi:hypothetical protein